MWVVWNVPCGRFAASIFGFAMGRKGQKKPEKKDKENAALKEALSHINAILTEKDSRGEDLEIGSTAFISCLRWSEPTESAL